jgi:transketolase
MALADKLDKNPRATIVLMGDGECYEGSVWEAAMFASHHELNNLCGIIDRNGLITHGNTEEINKLEPFAEKWKAFGWEVYEINGHDFKELKIALKLATNKVKKKPSMIIAKTVKGKGVSFMENQAKWHHGGIDQVKLKTAITELESKI